MYSDQLPHVILVILPHVIHLILSHVILVKAKLNWKCTVNDQQLPHVIL